MVYYFANFLTDFTENHSLFVIRRINEAVVVPFLSVDGGRLLEPLLGERYPDDMSLYLLERYVLWTECLEPSFQRTVGCCPCEVVGIGEEELHDVPEVCHSLP